MRGARTEECCDSAFTGSTGLVCFAGHNTETATLYFAFFVWLLVLKISCLLIVLVHSLVMVNSIQFNFFI